MLVPGSPAVLGLTIVTFKLDRVKRLSLEARLIRSTSVSSPIQMRLSRVATTPHHAQLPELSIKVRALNTERLGGITHAAMVLSHD